MAETSLPPYTPTQERIGSFLIHYIALVNTWVYRISGGRIFGYWLRGAPILLLTTIGRKSGERRTTPVIYLEDGDNVVIAASKGGMSHHPLWYRNLEANPDVEIEIGSRTRTMRARRATPEERSALWPRLAAMYPDFNDYQSRTSREIPVVILSPR